MSLTHWPAIKAALITRLATVSGLVVTGHFPKAIEPPWLFVTLRHFDRDTSGQVTAMPYQVSARLYVQWQDNEQAELELDSFVNPIPATVDADPTLGGVLQAGIAEITMGDPGFEEISGILYRTLDFSVRILEKATFRSGI